MQIRYARRMGIMVENLPDAAPVVSGRTYSSACASASGGRHIFIMSEPGAPHDVHRSEKMLIPPRAVPRDAFLIVFLSRVSAERVATAGFAPLLPHAATAIAASVSGPLTRRTGFAFAAGFCCTHSRLNIRTRTLSPWVLFC